MKTKEEILDDRLIIKKGYHAGARIKITEDIAKECMESYASQRESKYRELYEAILVDYIPEYEEWLIVNKKEWLSSSVECDLCGHAWVAVYHMKSDRLECPNCRNMTIPAYCKK